MTEGGLEPCEGSGGTAGRGKAAGVLCAGEGGGLSILRYSDL